MHFSWQAVGSTVTGAGELLHAAATETAAGSTVAVPVKSSPPTKKKYERAVTDGYSSVMAQC